MKKNGLLFFILLCTVQLCFAQKKKSYQLPNKQPEPILFGEGKISTGDYETHQAFSISGDTLCFIKSAIDFSTWTICISYFKNNQWTEPEVAPFSGTYNDADPFFTADGKSLYFISNRPIKKGDPPKQDTDIWRVDIIKGGWAEPVHLDAPVNSNMDEWYPTLADNGNLYFGSARAGGKGNTDLYVCKLVNGKYLTAENLGEALNTPEDEYEPFIAPDESYLIFMASSPANTKGHLYVSYNRNGQWTKAEKLPAPFNSDRTEYAPKVTRDGKYFFFSSTRKKAAPATPIRENMQQLNKRVRGAGNGLGDIYQVDFSALKLKLD